MKLTFTRMLLLAAACFSGIQANALIYTAVQNGNYNSATTWGGTIPPADILANSIVIPTGIQVTADVNIRVSSLSTFQLQGTGRLVAAAGQYINIVGGQITGDITSLISMDSVYIDGIANFLYNGTISSKKMTLAAANITPGMKLQAREHLYLATGATSLDNSTYLEMGVLFGTRPVLHMRGGSLALTPGATVDMHPYDLRYETGATQIGSNFEMPNDSLININIAIPGASTLTATADLTINDSITLTSGTLDIVDKIFTLAQDAYIHSAAGALIVDPTTNIHISSSAPDLGLMKFNGINPTVGSFTINAAAPTNTIKLATALSVDSELVLQNGIINVQGNVLTVRNNTGVTTGGGANSYVITETNGQLRQEVLGDSTVAFHVGTANGYAPAIISSNNGKHFPEMTVNVATGVKAAGATGTDLAASEPLVNATWTTSHTGTQTNVDYDMTMAWSASMEVNSFDRTKCFGTQYTSGKWQKYTPGPSAPMGSMHSASKPGAQSFGTFTVFDLNTLGITDVASGKTIQVYPNPAKDVLHFGLNSSEPVNVAIYNTTGQAVANATLNNAGNSIQVSSLPAGVYYIQLSGNGMSGTTKFVKQ